MMRILSSEKVKVTVGLALLFLVALVPSLIGLLNGNWPFSDDAVGLFAPARQWARASLTNGILPLWNPHVFLGMPFMGNGQTAVLYPPNILYWILPVKAALFGDALFHGVLLGVGGYFLARTLERSRLASLLCGICLILGNGVAAHLYAGHMTWHAARAYLPLEVAVLILYLREANQRYAVILAALFALQFYSGYPPYVIWSIAWCGVFFVAWRASQTTKADVPAARRQRLKPVWPRHVLLAAVLCLLLSAMALLPFRETSRLGAHGIELPFSQAIIPSSTLGGWARLVLPNFFGGNNSAQWSLKSFPHEEAAYIGILPLMLALGAPFWLKRSQKPVAAAFNESRFAFVLWAVLLLAMLFALGNHTPLYRFVFDNFPPMRMFRAPSRWMEIWYFGACLLAAFGFDALKNSRKNLELLLRLLLGATAVFVVLAIIVGMSSSSNFWLESAQWNTKRIISAPAERTAYAEYLWMTAFISVVCAMGIALFSILLVRGWQAGSESMRIRWQAGLLALIAVDLLLPFWGSAQLMKPDDVRSQWPPAIARFYDSGTRWVAAFEGDDVNFGLNQGVPLNIDALGGYDVLASNYFFDFAAAIDQRKIWSSQYQPSRLDPLWQVAGVTHAYVSVGSPLTAKLRASGAKLVASFGSKKSARQLWRLDDSNLKRIWPRYYLANRVVHAPYEHQLSMLKRLAQGPPVAVLAPGADLIEDASIADGRVRLVQHKANIVHLEIETSAPRYMVQSEALLPGWKAWVDGREAKIERANFLFRGIAVPAGESNVAIVYDNQTFRFGAFLTLCGLGMLAGIFSAARRSPPKPR